MTVSIATDRQGNVYVGDNQGNRIEKFDGNGKFLGKWGSLGDGDGQFDYVFKLTVDKDGNVYVSSDGGFDRIQKFKPVSQPLEGGSGTAVPTPAPTSSQS